MLGHGSAGHSHLVQLYESDGYLVRTVHDFIAAGWAAGEPALLIATKDHARALDEALELAGTEPQEARRSGRLVVLDAADTLARFMVNGQPDRVQFFQVVGDAIEAARNDGPLRAFGEMVAVLWAEGNVTGAIALERLWNELLVDLPVTLLCAYPMSGFNTGVGIDSFLAVCDEHTNVIPAESYSDLPSATDRLKNVAALQQQVGASLREHDQLRDKQAQLEAALSKLEELDRIRNDFVAMVVHDIRTPNAIVRHFLELLRSNWGQLDEDKIDDLLERSIANTNHVGHLVDDMLTVARLESGEFSFDIGPFDIAEVVYRAVGAARGDGTRRIEVSIPDGLPEAQGDQTRQIQILNNLLSNALKFSSADSTVMVTARPERDAVRVSVIDQGIGIPAHEHDKLFQRFARVGAAKTPGTGLGLYITKALVEGQGGEISFQSEPDVGSTFSYTVPVARPRPV